MTVDFFFKQLYLRNVWPDWCVIKMNQLDTEQTVTLHFLWPKDVTNNIVYHDFLQQSCAFQIGSQRVCDKNHFVWFLFNNTMVILFDMKRWCNIIEHYFKWTGAPPPWNKVIFLQFHIAEKSTLHMAVIHVTLGIYWYSKVLFIQLPI